MMQNNLLSLDDCEKPAEWSQLRNLVRALIGSALVFAVVLLVSSIRGIPEQTHGYLSSLPLALAGFGYALLQIALHPGNATLLKRLLLAATFVAWAVDQVLPAGKAAVFLGDLVIAAYILDLYWIAQDQMKEHLGVLKTTGVLVDEKSAAPPSV